MTLFYRTVLYTFIVLLSVVYRLTNAAHNDTDLLSTEEASFSETTGNISSTTILPVTNSTVNPSTISVLNTSTAISVTTSITDSTTTIEANTSTIDSSDPPDVSLVPSGPGWWLLIALLITIVIVIIAGVIFYYRQHSPYRRFLRNWRSHDEDADNIILQLEQPEVTNGQWPPRISFT